MIMELTKTRFIVTFRYFHKLHDPRVTRAENKAKLRFDSSNQSCVGGESQNAGHWILGRHPGRRQKVVDVDTAMLDFANFSCILD